MADQAVTTRERSEAETEFNRIVAFTDGIFAIAITLLVLTLEIPAGRDLGDELSSRADEFVAYFLSFAVLARFWLAHHRFYGRVARFDGRLLALNLFYLAFIALLPFSTELLGEYSDDSLGVAIYAANLTVIGISFAAQIHYCTGAGLVHDQAHGEETRLAAGANWVVAGVFGSSIPVAFISPTAATVMWLSMFFFGRAVGDRVARRRPPGRPPG